MMINKYTPWLATSRASEWVSWCGGFLFALHSKFKIDDLCHHSCPGPHISIIANVPSFFFFSRSNVIGLWLRSSWEMGTDCRTRVTLWFRWRESSWRGVVGRCLCIPDIMVKPENVFESLLVCSHRITWLFLETATWLMLKNCVDTAKSTLLRCENNSLFFTV